jgi:hypothetical protein
MFKVISGPKSLKTAEKYVFYKRRFAKSGFGPQNSKK